MLGFFFKASENLKTPLIGKTIGQEREMVTYMPREGGGGVLGISSDRDDRRIFWGLKFSIPGFFWVRKFGKYFLG